MSLCLLMLLAGCAHNSVVTKVVPVPPELTQPIPEPQLEGENNAALVDLIERLKAALERANRQLQAIGQIH